MREAAVEKYIAERRAKDCPGKDSSSIKEVEVDEGSKPTSDISTSTPKRGRKNQNNEESQAENQKLPASSKNAGSEK